MVDKIYLNAYAKINLSLHIENKRLDGFHNIESLITFTNLHDEVFIKFSDKSNLSYTGEFKPNSKYFKDDIILKVLKDLQIKKKLFISIKKNIPTKSGLASASTNAASLIKGLEKLNLIKKKILQHTLDLARIYLHAYIVKIVLLRVLVIRLIKKLFLKNFILF